MATRDRDRRRREAISGPEKNPPRSGRHGQTVPELDYEERVVLPEEMAHARGVVAANARDATDARDLLEMLGMLPGQEHWYKNRRTRRKMENDD